MKWAGKKKKRVAHWEDVKDGGVEEAVKECLEKCKEEVEEIDLLVRGKSHRPGHPRRYEDLVRRVGVSLILDKVDKPMVKGKWPPQRIAGHPVRYVKVKKKSDAKAG